MDLPRFLHQHQQQQQHQHQHQRRYVPIPPTHPQQHHSHPPPPVHESRNLYHYHQVPPQREPPPPPPQRELPPPPPLSSYRPLHALPPPPPYNPHISQFTFRNPSPNRSIDEHHDFKPLPPRVFDDDRRVIRHRNPSPKRAIDEHLDFKPIPPRVFDDDRRVRHRNPSPKRAIDEHLDFKPLPPRVFDDDRRVRHRKPEFDHFSDSRRDVWDSPPRVLPENRSIRPYPALDLDHESRRHVFDRKPISPYPATDKFRNDPEGSSRFREDFNDGFVQNHEEEFAWDRIHDGGSDDYRRGNSFVSKYSKSSRNPGFGSSQVSDLNMSSREFAGSSGKFEARYGLEFDELFRNDREDGTSENQRWIHNRQPLRNLPDSPFHMGSNGYSDGDEVQVFSGKRVSGGSEFGNLESKVSGESTQEYDRTPKKKLQKKSAFLRIQMGRPNNRNRDDAQLQSSGYYESNSAPFRSKDPPVYSNRRMKEDEAEREGSPVELDVSFKSNLLVAKAIVAPSSPAVSSVRNLTPNNNRKIRKLDYSDMDSSISPTVKANEGSINLESSTNVSNCPSKSVEADTVSLGKKTVERSPKATVSARDGKIGSSGRKSVLKVTKKKVVKKDAIPRSSSSNSLSAKTNNEAVKAGNSTQSPSATSKFDEGYTQSKEQNSSDGTVTACSVDFQTSRNEVTMLPESNKLDSFPQAIVSAEDGTKIDSGNTHVPKNVKKTNSSKEEYCGQEGPLRFVNSKENKNNEGFVDTDGSIHSFHAISNSDSGLIIFEADTTLPDINSVGNVKQCVKNGVCVALENDAVRECSQAMIAGCNLDFGLSNSEESMKYEGPVIMPSSNHEVENALSTGDGSISPHEIVTVSDVNTVGADGKQFFPNQVAESPECGLVEGFSKDVPSVDLSISEDGINHEGPVDAENSYCGSVTDFSSGNGLSNSQEKVTFTNIGTKGYLGKQPDTDEATISLENGSKEWFPKAMVSVDSIITVASDKDCAPDKIENRELGVPQSNSLNLSATDICVGPVPRVSSGDGLDITSSPKNFSLASEEITVFGVVNMDDGSEVCTDGFSDLQRKTSLEGFSEDKIPVGYGDNVSLNGVSHEYKKKRKVFTPHTGLSSPTMSDISEGPDIAGTPASGSEVPSNFNNDLQEPGEVSVSSMTTACAAGLSTCLEGNSVLHENTVAAGSFEALGSVKDGIRDDGLKLEKPTIDSELILKESTILNVRSSCSLGLQGEQTENATSVMVTTTQQNVNMDMESVREENFGVHSTNEQVVISSETASCKIPLEFQTLDSDQMVCSSDMECDSVNGVKDDLPSVSNYISLCAYGDGVSITNYNDDGMDTLPDTPSNMGSPETLFIVPEPDAHMLSSKLSDGQISNEIVSEAEEKLEENSVVGLGSDNVTVGDNLFTSKSVTLPLQDLKSTRSQNPTCGEANGGKNQLSCPVPQILRGRSSVYFTNSGKASSSKHITKQPRTWIRTGNPSASPLPEEKSLSSAVPPLSHLSKKIGKNQSTSYIRKGNSLVRKPALVTTLPQGSHGLNSSINRLSTSGIDELKKSTGSDGRVDLPDPVTFSRTGGMSAALQRPLGTLTLPHSPGDCTSPPLAEPVVSGCSETTSEPLKLIEDKGVPKSSEDAPKSYGIPESQSDSVKSFEIQGGVNDENLVSSKLRNLIYVKRKSNQLVAASNPCNTPAKIADKAQALSSDGYYKRKRNQLIRTSLKSHINQQVIASDDSLNSEGQRAPRVISSRIFSKKWSDKGTCNPSKFSRVWTLRGTQSSKEIDNSFHRKKVLPHLFPWKRAAYRKKFVQNSATIPSNSTLSMISRKLLLLRNRGAVYTRSTHGLSLRKSKVLSVGGGSLKWSMSIERRSKKANEEATQAVAAAERKKREHDGAACDTLGAKTRNHSSSKSVHGIKLHPGERIYRIGSVRYKMDSSKRTLQRISDDDDTSFSVALERKDVKKSYVPRRLVIGNDEYVRIGNGNQLIRDPKKRTRTLANEKVRWSLHTARLRLARKRKYCQFFTRFGTCNKDDGKCPYIHDPSKIAVCTKFLKGLCSNSNCKLTHKVIPERMQDCSYFLQGLCSNENCPYRHVNVNTNASICEGFLRGYCANGNECRKKHSYVCPVFEASGLCPQGSKCKLHHPKNRSEVKKKKRSKEQKNRQGRYFGSPLINVAESGVVSDMRSTQNNDDITFADYISLDEDARDTIDLPGSFDDSDSDLQLDDLDEFVKPIGLIKNSLTA